jgi:hypothetical protein
VGDAHLRPDAVGRVSGPFRRLALCSKYHCE